MAWKPIPVAGGEPASQEPCAICMPGSADSLRKLGAVGKEVLVTGLVQSMAQDRGGSLEDCAETWK